MNVENIKRQISNGEIKPGDAIPRIPNYRFVEFDGEDVIVVNREYRLNGLTQTHPSKSFAVDSEEYYNDEAQARIDYEACKTLYEAMLDLERIHDYQLSLERIEDLGKLVSRDDDVIDMLDIVHLDISEVTLEFTTAEEYLSRERCYGVSVVFEGALDNEEDFDDFHLAVKYADAHINKLKEENPHNNWEVQVYDRFENCNKYGEINEIE